MIFDTADAWGPGRRQNPLPNDFLILDDVRDVVQFMRDNRRGAFRVLLKCDEEEMRLNKTFLQLCRLIWVVRDVVLGVDEVWEFCDAERIPAPFGRLLLRGRTPGITICWAAQFPATVSRRLTGASTELRIFRVTEESDLNSPALTSKVGRDVRAILPRLPDRVFVRWSPGRPWQFCTSDTSGTIKVLDTESFKKSIGV